MLEISIITGKIITTKPAQGSVEGKKMYVKIFPGAFSMEAPRFKKGKVLVGELLVRYSGREWPEKKNGPLVGDQGFLNGISELLKELDLVNVDKLSWKVEQRPLKETVTIRVGTELAQEMIDRGWAKIEEKKVVG